MLKSRREYLEDKLFMIWGLTREESEELRDIREQEAEARAGSAGMAGLDESYGE